MQSNYNTRRKSLSLSELGIIPPKRARTVSHPAPPSKPAANDDSTEPPVKKSKRSHDSASPPAGLMSPPKTTTIRVKEEKPKRATELSPPPSPAVEGSNKIDVEGINDEIVVRTIQQLEKTGNRPHLVKELGAVLSTHLPSVERSANQPALISAHLTAYLNRPWPTISPCPLAKDLSPVHPRRLFFYLTTMPRQPLPEVTEQMVKSNRIISPSLSSASAHEEEDDEQYSRQRAAISPSPEVDLSSPELDDETQDQHGSFSSRGSIPRAGSDASNSMRRAVSPQLENEERDFKQTANALYEQAQLRRSSMAQQEKDKDVSMDQQPATLSRTSTDSHMSNDDDSVAISIEDTADSEEQVAAQISNDAAALFGHSSHQMEFSSPYIQPQPNKSLQIDTLRLSPKHHEQKGTNERHDEVLDFEDMTLTSARPSLHDLELPDSKMEFNMGFDGWDALQSPEHVELDELDGMFDA